MAGTPGRPATPLSSSRVVLVSDTHLPRFGRALPRVLREAILGTAILAPPADVVLHLGDFTEPWVPDLFAELAPFAAVAGNNDGQELASRFGRARVVEVGGLRIGMTHGDLGVGRTTPERAAGSFRADEVDVVAFGHSHAPLVERLPDGRWLLNPGSPTDRRTQPRYSFAVLEVDGGVVRPELVFFDDRSP